ncbi:MAG: hypothetical protein K5Q00_03340 [Gammaproteobacteria bacterium]|nr:hypothetical protein [Gammaproteobacteria bacterium]
MANNPTAFQAILTQIRNNTAPALTDLNDAGLNDSDIAQLVSAMLSNSSVEHLYLKGNGAITEVGFQSLANLLAENTGLLGLALNSCNVNDADLIILVNGLRSNRNLYDLSLSINQITARGANELLKVMPTTAITAISLDVNNIGDDMAIAFAGLPNLRNLNCNSCALSAIGTQGIFEAMNKNKNLVGLHIGNNQFYSDGMQALADALTNGSPLQQLSLNDCRLPDIVVQPLIPCLAQNPVLYSLNLDGNNLSEGLAAEIGYALQNNYVMKFLHLTHNPITSNTVVINRILQRNQNYPWLNAYTVAINQGSVTTLTPNVFQANSARAGVVSQNIQYTIIDAQNCQFLLQGRPVTQFYQRDIDAGLVQVWHDGSYVTPRYKIQLSDGAFVSSAQQSVIRFIPFTGDFILTKNNLTIARGGVTTLTSNNLACVLGNSTVPAPGLIFNFNVTNGYVRYVGQTQAISSCLQGEIILAQVEVVHNDSANPLQMGVSLSDGNRTTNTLPVNSTTLIASSTITTTSAPGPTATTLLTTTNTAAPTAVTLLPGTTTTAATTSSSLVSSTTSSAIAPSPGGGAVAAVSSSVSRSESYALGFAGGITALVVCLLASYWWKRGRNNERYRMNDRERAAGGDQQRREQAPEEIQMWPLPPAAAAGGGNGGQAVLRQQVAVQPPQQPPAAVARGRNGGGAIHGQQAGDPPPYHAGGVDLAIFNPVYEVPPGQE